MYKILIIILIPFFCFGQAVKRDTTSILGKSGVKDSLIVSDSLLVKDSVDSSKGDIDSVVYASGSDSLIFNIGTKHMNIFGAGEIKYKETNLHSGKIFVDFKTNNVDAFGITTDSAGKVLTHTPVLKDKSSEYKGKQMKYNFKSEKGYITYARTEEDKTTYSGAIIKKMDKTNYFIQRGVYTSCDAETPHYAFVATEMKVIPDEQVVGKWIWLTFGGVPFPIPIPFAVFPLHNGRHSGIMVPTFGSRVGYGRYFSNFGYYWAINDYMDLTLTGDYYTRGGFGLNSRYRYSMKYNYSGSLEGGYSKLTKGEDSDADKSTQTDWNLKWNHQQQLTPTSRFDASMQFMSSSYYNTTSTDINQLLQNNIYSNASYSKTWEESGMNLTVNYSRSQNLRTGAISEDLPNISFSKSQFYPFKSKTFSNDEKWYDNIGVSYSAQAKSSRTATDTSSDIRSGVYHDISISASPKIGYINIIPSFSFKEIWYDKLTNQQFENINGKQELISSDENRFAAIHTFDASVSASTKFYGMFPINSFGVQAVRHTVIPSVSYNFRPDFSESGWGYYGSYVDTTGKSVKYDKFSKGVFGGASSGMSQSINFSISNIFEMKTVVNPNDTTAKEKKIQLLNLTASTGYNFAADSLRLSDISLVARTQIGDLLSISGSNTYSIYDVNKNGVSVNKTAFDAGKGLLRLKNLNLSLSTSISAETFADKDKKNDTLSKANKTNEEVFFNGGNNLYKGIYSTQDPDFSIPWSVSLSYNYNLAKLNYESETITSNISANFNFNLSKNWKFTVAGSYDIRENRVITPIITVNRDLHCWIMNFTWTPMGTYSGYKFEIRVKAPQLQDLKVEKSDGLYSGKR